MAITSITPTQVKRVDKAYALEAAAALGSLSSTDAAYLASIGTYGAKLPYEKKMGKYALLIENTDSASADVYVRHNHHEFFHAEDLKVTVAGSNSVALNIETAKFAQLNGEDKGYVYVVGASADIKVALIELPQSDP